MPFLFCAYWFDYQISNSPSRKDLNYFQYRDIEQNIQYEFGVVFFLTRGYLFKAL